MKKGGIGGSHTKTGLVFEKNTNILDVFTKLASYSVRENLIYHNGILVAESYPKNSFYMFLKKNNIDYKKIISTKLLPDDSLFVLKTKTFFIIEKKFQQVGGSTDEKLQTADFKIKQYRKLLAPLNLGINFIYILNNWFKHPRYNDVLNYINNIDGCNYFFGKIPLKYLDL